MFAKEIKLVVSRSSRAGRYDPSYEESGIDYPAGYVRWTEGRNIDEVLRLMGTGQLNPSRLLKHTFDLEQGAEASDLLDSGEPSLGILLRYPGRDDAGPRSIRVGAGGNSLRKRLGRDRPRLGVVGAGAFPRSVLLPALARHADITAI